MMVAIRHLMSFPCLLNLANNSNVIYNIINFVTPNDQTFYLLPAIWPWKCDFRKHTTLCGNLQNIIKEFEVNISIQYNMDPFRFWINFVLRWPFFWGIEFSRVSSKSVKGLNSYRGKKKFADRWETKLMDREDRNIYASSPLRRGIINQKTEILLSIFK